MAWKNWAGNQKCDPAEVAHPSTDAELAAVVKGAAARGRRVKVVGSGHSFTACALTDGVQIVLDRYNTVTAVDTENLQVTAQAGTTIADLNKLLWGYGMAMPNLGDIAYQTISGAISTATHGTGAKKTGIAGQVIALDIVSGDGSIVSCSPTEEKEIFESARVGRRCAGRAVERDVAVRAEVQPARGRRAAAGRRRAREHQRPRRQQRTLRVLLGAPHGLGAHQDEQRNRGRHPAVRAKRSSSRTRS